MLYNILKIDEYNLEAIVDLENYYEKAGVTEALVELYNKYKDTQAADAVAKYYVEAPAVSVEGGEYTTDIEVKLTSGVPRIIYDTSFHDFIKLHLVPAKVGIEIKRHI